jgi:phosphate transport system permease protein
MSAVAPEQRSLLDSPRVRRRKRVSRLQELAWACSSAIAVALLGLMVGSVVVKALPALSWKLFTHNQAPFGEAGGGIQNAIVGSAVLVAVATVMALPVGVLIAIYVSEFARPKVALLVRTALDILNSVPSIVIGIFVYGLLVLRYKQSALIASIALAAIMLPLVSRATQEVLALVPQSLREASQALGVSKWRTVLRVILPTTMGGILTGATLAVARAAGETAPIIFTTTLFTNTTVVDPRHPVNSIPFMIFFNSESPDPHLHQQAWAGAFILIVFVLVTSLTARYLLHRSQQKLQGRVSARRWRMSLAAMRGGGD